MIKLLSADLCWSSKFSHQKTTENTDDRCTWFKSFLNATVIIIVPVAVMSVSSSTSSRMVQLSPVLPAIRQNFPEPSESGPHTSNICSGKNILRDCQAIHCKGQATLVDSSTSKNLAGKVEKSADAIVCKGSQNINCHISTESNAKHLQLFLRFIH